MITVIYDKTTGTILAVAHPNQDSQGMFAQYSNADIITLPNSLGLDRFEGYIIDLETKTMCRRPLPT
jgi:hypothetical protein